MPESTVLVRGIKYDRVPVLSRRDFLQEFGNDYQNGQHFSAFGPTGRGKSHLTYQCLGRVIHENRQVLSLHGKIRGRDPVIGKAAHALGLRIVQSLPSAAQRKYDRKVRKCPGYIILPLGSPGESTEDENRLLEREYRRAIHDNYAETKRPTITHINEAHQTQEELRLRTACEGPLMRGAPDNAMWSEAQRGRYLSYHTYNAPEHLLIFYDDNREERKRYGDFGCADPEYIVYITSQLKRQRVADGRTISQCLYIRRGGGMYVVDT